MKNKINIKNLKIKILNHPLLKHKISILRNKKTNTNEFRLIVKEIALLEGFEALRDLKTINVKISTPLEKTSEPVIKGNKICFVPILRAGLGMVEGFINLIPSAKIGHIGLYRDLKTHLPIKYFEKLPKNIKNMNVYLIDPMLATGKTAVDAISCLRKIGVKKISFICIIAAPEGVKLLNEKFPNVPIYTGALDRELNKNAAILPGLGDAGDRIFGTNN